MNIRIPLLSCAAVLSLALAGCTTTPGNSGYYGNNSGYGSSCYDCGTVTRIEQVGGQPSSGVAGAVVGGLVGAAAGREIADDKSEGRRNTATAAGALAGAVAGSAIQRNMSNGSYVIHVRMSDGRVVTVTQDSLGGIREGSQVRVYNGRATLR